MSDQYSGSRGELSAAESQVLLTGPHTEDVVVLQLALLEMLVRGIVTLGSTEKRRFLVWSWSTSLGFAPVEQMRPVGRPLNCVLDAVRVTRGRTESSFELSVKDVALAVFRRYQSQGGFREACVLAALGERGLYRSESYKRLKILERHRWQITDSGISELNRLRELMRLGRAPDRAEEFLDRAGPAILLLADAFWKIERIDQSVPSERSIFATAALAGRFGPEGRNLSWASHLLRLDIEKAWERLHPRGE